MKKKSIIIMILVFLTGYLSLESLSKQVSPNTEQSNNGDKKMIKKVEKTNKEWKDVLTPEQYRVMRKSGTEKPFSGKYNNHYEKGIYHCAGCGTPLFSSETKYDHGTGWPSFTASFDENYIEYRKDNSLFMRRIEVRCAVCGAHLGHVFDDGPAPTSKHYCINSVSLDFKGADSQTKPESNHSEEPDERAKKSTKTEAAIFAAGCFWGVEDKFRKTPGVISTEVGYTGGHVKNPTYEQVCTDKTGHAEAVKITFDPSLVSYEELLEVFFSIHDATQINRQGPDIGRQYRSAIFYYNKEQKMAAEKKVKELESSGRLAKSIATEIVPASKFNKAEEYHQQYYEKRKKNNNGQCGTDSCLI
ncbi:MAG: bifunctional methionine sulfoxide reductase B/A protein [Candidatus Aminicenantes bacterium]|nr:bifunctional methionine sulfoxide reductase B/A protein [Candidatus Aminicenantes bacterium]